MLIILSALLNIRYWIIRLRVQLHHRIEKIL